VSPVSTLIRRGREEIEKKRKTDAHEDAEAKLIIQRQMN